MTDYHTLATPLPPHAASTSTTNSFSLKNKQNFRPHIPVFELLGVELLCRVYTSAQLDACYTQLVAGNKQLAARNMMLVARNKLRVARSLLRAASCAGVNAALSNTWESVLAPPVPLVLPVTPSSFFLKIQTLTPTYYMYKQQILSIARPIRRLTSTKARFPFKRNRVRCVRCVNENRKKRKRLRFLRFSFTQRTQRKRLRLNGNRA